MHEHAVRRAPSRRAGSSPAIAREPSREPVTCAAAWRKHRTAELEVVDRDALVRRVDQPRRELGSIVAHREEAVRDGAERLAQPVAVGEPGDADRAARPPRARPPRRSSRPRPRAASRAASACRRGPRSTRARSRPRRARSRSRRLDLGLRLAGQEAAVDDDLAERAGSRSACCEAEIIVGESVSESSGSSSSAAAGRSSRASSSASAASSGPPATACDERLDLRAEPRLGRVRREPLDQRRRLDERVVGDPRHRRVARCARARAAGTASSSSPRSSRGRRPARRARPARRRPR